MTMPRSEISRLGVSLTRLCTSSLYLLRPITACHVVAKGDVYPKVIHFAQMRCSTTLCPFQVQEPRAKPNPSRQTHGTNFVRRRLRDPVLRWGGGLLYRAHQNLTPKAVQCQTVAPLPSYPVLLARQADSSGSPVHPLHLLYLHSLRTVEGAGGRHRGVRGRAPEHLGNLKEAVEVRVEPLGCLLTGVVHACVPPA